MIIFSRLASAKASLRRAFRVLKVGLFAGSSEGNLIPARNPTLVNTVERTKWLFSEIPKNAHASKLFHGEIE